MIKRIEVVVNGVKTFKIVSAEAEIEEEKVEELSLKTILERLEEISSLPPCFGCLERECEAVRCLKLEAWFLKRVMSG